MPYEEEIFDCLDRLSIIGSSEEALLNELRITGAANVEILHFLLDFLFVFSSLDLEAKSVRSSLDFGVELSVFVANSELSGDCGKATFLVWSELE